MAAIDWHNLDQFVDDWVPFDSEDIGWSFYGTRARRDVPLRRTPPGWWKTMEGHLIRIDHMSDKHLLNTARYLMKNSWMAHPSYPELCLEIEKRGLRPIGPGDPAAK